MKKQLRIREGRHGGASLVLAQVMREAGGTIDHQVGGVVEIECSDDIWDNVWAELKDTYEEVVP